MLSCVPGVSRHTHMDELCHTHMNESCNTNESRVAHLKNDKGQVSLAKEPYKRDMHLTNESMSHSLVNESWHTHMNESWHTHMNESWPAHMNESWHTHMNESWHTYE